MTSECVRLGSGRHLPFLRRSAAGFTLARGLRLPTFGTAGVVLLGRLTLVIDDGVIRHLFHPVFPPDRGAEAVIAWLR